MPYENEFDAADVAATGIKPILPESEPATNDIDEQPATSMKEISDGVAETALKAEGLRDQERVGPADLSPSSALPQISEEAIANFNTRFDDLQLLLAKINADTIQLSRRLRSLPDTKQIEDLLTKTSETAHKNLTKTVSGRIQKAFNSVEFGAKAGANHSEDFGRVEELLQTVVRRDQAKGSAGFGWFEMTIFAVLFGAIASVSAWYLKPAPVSDQILGQLISCQQQATETNQRMRCSNIILDPIR